MQINLVHLKFHMPLVHLWFLCMWSALHWDPGCQGQVFPGLRRNRSVEALLNVIFPEVLLFVGIISLLKDHASNETFVPLK